MVLNLMTLGLCLSLLFVMYGHAPTEGVLPDRKPAAHRKIGGLSVEPVHSWDDFLLTVMIVPACPVPPVNLVHYIRGIGELCPCTLHLAVEYTRRRSHLASMGGVLEK